MARERDKDSQRERQTKWQKIWKSKRKIKEQQKDRKREKQKTERRTEKFNVFYHAYRRRLAYILIHTIVGKKKESVCRNQQTPKAIWTKG